MKRLCGLSAIVLLAANGCAVSRNPHEEYSKAIASATPVATSDLRAIENATALAVQPGHVLKTRITTADPRIESDEVQANYKVFEIRGTANSRYTVELRSLCNCWGVNKSILYPVVRILDRDGNTVGERLVDVSLRNADWKHPVNIGMVLEGEFEKDDTYYLLVSAYNEHVGASYLTFKEFDYLANRIQAFPPAQAYLDLLSSVGDRSEEVPDPSMHPLWSSPTGRIEVTLTFQPE